MDEKRLLIGLSVSLCILDILEGKVKEEEVFLIIAGTCCIGSEWKNAVETYQKLYWRNSPEEAEKILNRLISANKIVQPRLEEFHAPSLVGGRWLDLNDIDNVRRIHL